MRKGSSRIPASNTVENLADVSTVFEAGIRELPFSNLLFDWPSDFQFVVHGMPSLKPLCSP